MPRRAARGRDAGAGRSARSAASGAPCRVRWRLGPRRRRARRPGRRLWIVAAQQTAGAEHRACGCRRSPPPGRRWPSCGRAAPCRPTWPPAASACCTATASASPSASWWASPSGAFPGVEGGLEAPIGFLRYIPASALTPLMLLWLGVDEAPKITLIVVGTVFFNILMVADVARSVPRELIDAAATPGGIAAPDRPARVVAAPLLAGHRRRGPHQPGGRLADAGGGRAAGLGRGPGRAHRPRRPGSSTST